MKHFRFAGDGRLDDYDYKAHTVAGEIVRATAVLCSRWNCHGEKVGTGYGWKTCGPAADFIIAHTDQLTGYFLCRLSYEAPGMNEEEYNAKLNRVYDAILFFLDRHPELQEVTTDSFMEEKK